MVLENDYGKQWQISRITDELGGSGWLVIIWNGSNGKGIRMHGIELGTG